MDCPQFSTFISMHQYQSNQDIQESSIFNTPNNDTMFQEPEYQQYFPFSTQNNINAEGYSNELSNNAILNYQDPDFFFNIQSNANQDRFDDLFGFSNTQQQQLMSDKTNQKTTNDEDDKFTLYEKNQMKSGYEYSLNDCADCKHAKDDTNNTESQSLYDFSSNIYTLQQQNFSHDYYEGQNQYYYNQPQQNSSENNYQMFQEQQQQEEEEEPMNHQFQNQTYNYNQNQNYQGQQLVQNISQNSEIDETFQPQIQNEIEQENQNHYEEEKMNEEEQILSEQSSENERNELRQQRNFISLAHRNMKMNFGTGLIQYIEFLVDKKKVMKSEDLEIYQRLFTWVLSEVQSFRCFNGWQDLWTDATFGHLLRKVSQQYFSEKNSLATTYVKHSNIKPEYKNEYLRKIIKFQQGAENPKSFNAFAFKA